MQVTAKNPRRFDSAAERRRAGRKDGWHCICSRRFDAFEQKQNHTQHGDKFMEGENNTGNSLIWAITTIIIVAIIAGAVYYSGFLNGNRRETKDINVEVKVPGASNSK